MEVAYFKVFQQYGIYLYYKVTGGKGITVEGYLEEINFLTSKPKISILHNDINSKTGTWTIYEKGTPISKEKYNSAFIEETQGDFKIV